MESLSKPEWAQVRSAPEADISNSMFLLDWMVGAEGFEPPTLCSQSRCATRLRYAPTSFFDCIAEDLAFETGVVASGNL